MTYSGWLVEAALKELKVRAGLEAVADVERQLGPFTGEELANAHDWARATVERARRAGAPSRRGRAASRRAA